MVAWPTVIVSTAQDVRLIEGGKERIIHSGKGLYYGITWDQDRIFVLSRNGGINKTSPVILEFDKEYNVAHSKYTGNFVDGHQIYCDGKKLYVTSTARNALEVVDFATGETEEYNWTEYTDDVNHINSVWKGKEGFWFSYHNLFKVTGNPSEVVKVDFSLCYVMENYVFGRGNHNVVRIGNILYTCSSNDGMLCLFDLTKKEVVKQVYVGHWVRGMGITDSHVVLGVTQVSESREERLVGNSELCLLDKEHLSVIDSVVLENSGSVYDLRLCGVTDYAHNGIDFPGDLYV